METCSEFHDGQFNGLLIEEGTVYVFVSTYENRRSVFIARNVLVLLADEITTGNIILDLSLRAAEEMPLDEIPSRMHQRPPHSSSGIDNKILEKARAKKLTALTIDPFYGATCLILAESFEQITYEDWRRSIAS